MLISPLSLYPLQPSACTLRFLCSPAHHPSRMLYPGVFALYDVMNFAAIPYESTCICSMDMLWNYEIHQLASTNSTHHVYYGFQLLNSGTFTTSTLQSLLLLGLHLFDFIVTQLWYYQALSFRSVHLHLFQYLFLFYFASGYICNLVPIKLCGN